MPRSRWPCQSIFTGFCLTISCLTNFTNAFTPSGVACPTVSARQIRPAPHSIAAPYSALIVSGRARVVSSVTYMTGKPCSTAYVTASSVAATMRSTVQSSVYCRIGEEPMNVAASILIPTSFATRTIGSISAMTVRAAQFGAIGSLWSRISLARARTCSTTRGPAPGKPISAATIPRSAIRCNSRFLTSSDGSVTDGDCRPSRRVSSFSSTRARVAEMFGEAGLDKITIDAVGNVRSWCGKRETGNDCVVLSAHLDTVFGPEFDVSVARRGPRLEGPGIADNARGLAALVAIGEALVRARVETRRPVLFAATVGEEGSGDLRGVRHLLGPSDRPTVRPSAFIALDGA